MTLNVVMEGANEGLRTVPIIMVQTTVIQVHVHVRLLVLTDDLNLIFNSKIQILHTETHTTMFSAKCKVYH